MKRLLKFATLLVVSLFLLISGVNVTLDQLARSQDNNSYTYYDQNGAVIMAYSGNLAYCRSIVHPVSPAPALHRT